MAEAAGSIRAFVAFDLDAPTRLRLAETTSRLGRLVRGIRWVREEGMHLTLRFLGQASPAALDALSPPLATAAAACPAASVPVRGIGFFPERGRVRVLWVGIGLTPAMLALQEEVERAAVSAGFPPEPRAFSPHLTLGRWMEPAPPPVLPEVDLGQTLIDRLVLYRSQLHPGGSVYTPLASLALGGEGSR
jgi:2'-5' RNA ligase